MPQQSRIADVFEKYLNFKASLRLDRLISDEAAFSSALARAKEEYKRILREELPAALEEDMQKGVISYDKYTSLCAGYGIEAIPPPREEMSWEEKALVATINKWWEMKEPDR